MSDSSHNTVLPYEAALPPDAPRSNWAAVTGLVVATLLWGCGFTWGKIAIDDVHAELALPKGSPLGPLLTLGLRFIVGALVVLLVHKSWQGWTRRGMVTIGLVGTSLAGGLILQHRALDLENESLTAFLTSLSIVVVPVMMLILTRKPPARILWVGVALAVAGVWLMTGVRPAGFGLGATYAILGVLCFSVQIIAVNAIAKKETPWRVTAGQFLTVGVICVAGCFIIDDASSLTREKIESLARHRSFLLNMGLQIVFPTILAFGLMFFFQPRIDPTRATLIYMLEPIFAAAWAYLQKGDTMTGIALIGGALILGANLLVELMSRHDAPPPPIKPASQ